MLLKDKTAVVTGCNRGIGKRILKTFSENEYKYIAFHSGQIVAVQLTDL